MGDDADVLAFRGRWGAPPSRDPGASGRDAARGTEGYDRGRCLSDDLAELTQVVVIGDRVVDVVRRPVSGSEYECVALDLSSVPTHRRDRVAALDDTVVDVVPRLLGGEALTAARRLLVQAVSREPGVLTRSDRDDIAVGAVVWAVGRGNGLVGPNRPVRSSAVSDALGLRSSPSSRGEAFARAAGGGTAAPWLHHYREPQVVALGDPGLLVARFRRRLVALRDLAVALRAATPSS